MSTSAPAPGPQISEDERILHKMGYAQELFRGMGGFQNFAISFTIISILAGCLTSYYIAFESGGPIAVTWGWLIVGLFSTIIALGMAEIASAFPTAGGLYYWASKLGSPGWGWATGWFNLIGQIAVEFDAHLPLARKAGISEAKISALQAEEIGGGFTALERAVLTLTDTMTRDVQVPDAQFEPLRAHFDARGLVELVATVAAYNMVSRFLEALNIGH